MTMSLNSIKTKIQGYELPLLHMHSEKMQYCQPFTLEEEEDT